MEAPAISDRREEEGHRQLRPEKRRRCVACGDAHGIARPEQDIVPAPAVVAQGDFGFGAAVDVVEDHVGNTTTGEPAEVVDVQDTIEGAAEWGSHQLFGFTEHTQRALICRGHVPTDRRPPDHAGPAAHPAGDPSRRNPDQRAGLQRRIEHAVGDRERAPAPRSQARSGRGAVFDSRHIGGARLRRAADRPRQAVRRSSDPRDADLLRKAADLGRLEGAHQRSGPRRELSHQQGPASRPQAAARHQRSRAADRVRVPRHADSPAHRRPDVVGRDRRADDREPGASGTGVGPLDAGRLQERYGRRGEDGRRRGAGRTDRRTGFRPSRSRACPPSSRRGATRRAT